MLNTNTFTIMAPTDDAFSDLLEEEFDNLVYVMIIINMYYIILFLRP